jgi:hypothetical protein
MRELSCDKCGTKNLAIAITGMEMQTLWSEIEHRFFNCGTQKSDSETLDLCPKCAAEIINLIKKKKE